MKTDYRFYPGVLVTEEARRIADGLAHEALETLDGAEPDQIEATVHEARKRCKEVRGLLRLVRAGLDNDYREANRLFRDAGRALAPIRDAHAAVGTFDALVAANRSRVPEHGVLDIRAELVRRSEHATDAILGPEVYRLDDAKAAIRAARDRIGGWVIPDRFAELGAGVRKTYKRGKHRCEECLEGGDPDVFHQWRKRTKYLWYEMRLLEAAAPSILRPLVKRLHDVSDALGDAHDLAELAKTFAEWSDVDSRQREAATEMADACRNDLEDRALSVGTRLYAEKPKAFVSRIELYWEAWRRSEERPTGEIADLFEACDELGSRTYEELYELAKATDLSGRSSMSRDELERSLRVSKLP